MQAGHSTQFLSLFALLLTVSLCLGTAPAPRLRCQDASGALLPSADVCQDVDPGCAAVFTGPVVAPAVRPAECDIDLLKDAATKCAKTCKICCELPQYSCSDQPNPPVPCADALRNGQCTDPGWRDVLKVSSPATCGLCQAAPAGDPSCQDRLPSCQAMVGYCSYLPAVSDMKKNCARTCKDAGIPGYCDTPVSPPPSTQPPNGPNGDLGSNCAQNKDNCNNPDWYDFMTKNCCKTCNRCGAAAAACMDEPVFGDNKPTHCNDWMRNGFCTRPDYAGMRQLCRRTCGLCR